MDLNDEHAEILGEQLVDVLGLRVSGGEVYTSFGSKSPIGLVRVIEDLIEDARTTQRMEQRKS